MVLFVLGMTTSLMNALVTKSYKLCRQIELTLTPTLRISSDIELLH